MEEIKGMKPKYTIALKNIVEEHHLEILHRSANYENVRIGNYNVARPSLQLIGFFDYFEADRIRVWGRSESAFLATLSPEMREEVLGQLFSRNIPVLILCNAVEPDPAILKSAQKYDVTLLATDMDTSEFIAQVINTLRTALSPRTTVHGVLIQVHGEGLLITGESGIGKSEVALELVKRGHRLVADDAVEIRRMSRYVLDGCAPKMIQYLMELRGVGLIDVRRIYGIGAVLPKARIDLVVNFVHWKEDMHYDRMGLDEESTTILEVKVPQLTIPVAPARNLAIILEVAAMNHRQKMLGYNTAREFLKRHDGKIDTGDSFDE
ncbi:MAG: HPr(Ser) kinase/phosphatase [Oscillospiraceae bacterium]|nr:HPr(Ser) kinase/phosphatase [Oscillospiraceae bacterium]